MDFYLGLTVGFVVGFVVGPLYWIARGVLWVIREGERRRERVPVPLDERLTPGRKAAVRRALDLN